MKATLTDEQQMYTQAAERMAANGLEAAQATLAGAKWPTQPDASLLADWSGLGVSEKAGGAGGGLVDVVFVINELARTLVPTRFISHAMAIQVAGAAGLPLAPAVAGEQAWALAVSEPGADSFGPFSTVCSNGVIDGRKTGVPFGETADAAVVVGRDDRVAIGVPSARKSSGSADRLSQIADLTFDGVPANDAEGAANGVHRAMVIVAAELCGAARGALAIGADYATERIQCGRPIGSFQGVAHQLAEAYAGLEGAWSLTIYAAWALDYARPDAAKHVYLAKGRAAEAAVFAAERVLQVHGGMGMTWEAAPHLFLRRALSRSAWLGGAAWHRRAAGAAVLRNLAQD